MACRRWRCDVMLNGGDGPLEQARRALSTADALFARLLAVARERTEHGRRIDEAQVLTQQAASTATELRAAAEFVAYAERATAAGRGSDLLERLALASAASIAHRLRCACDAQPEHFGADDDAAGEDRTAPAAVRAGLSNALLTELGRTTIEAGG